MQTDESSLLCSMSYMDTATSLALILPDSKPNGPRFRRSRSGERSRSKENCQANDNPSFFVKNCFSRQQGQHSPDSSEPKGKRRNNHLRRRDTHSPPRQDDPESLIQHCEELNQLLEKSHSYIMELEGRVAELEEERGRGEGRERPRENRGNLAKLRKQIADTRVVERVPGEVLQQQVKQLQAESLCLRGEVVVLRETIRQQEKEARHATTQHELQLEATILHLRQSLFSSEKREGQLRMEIGRLRLRVSKQDDNQQQAKSEQLAYLRFRYEKMRRKFEENKKLLQCMERRQEASRYLFGEEEREVSFSLSP